MAALRSLHIRQVKAALVAVTALLAITPGAAMQGGGNVGPGQRTPNVSLPPAPPPPAEGTAALSGVVIDGATKAPLADALVYLAVDGRGTVGPQSRQFTDAKGRFAFVNLPANTRYTLTGSKFGYLEGGYGRQSAPAAANAFIAVREGEWVADARITMWRPGAIGGTVVDERGEPVVGTYVRVLARMRILGRDELAAGPLTTTDDRGMYRVSGLAPGRYLVQVPSVQTSLPAGSPLPVATPALPPGTPATGPTSEPALELDGSTRLLLRNFPTPPPRTGERALAYPITFYPSAQTASAATIVDLKFGDDRSGVNITIEPVQASRISGVVEGPPEALTNLTLRLIPEGLESLGHGSEAATALVGADGRFTFLNVPAGAYTIDAPRTVGEFTTTRSVLAPPGTGFPPPPRPGNSGWGMMSLGVDSASPGTSFATSTFRSSPANYVGRGSVVVSGHDETDVHVAMRPAGTMTGRVIKDTDPNRETPAVGPASVVQLEPANGSPSLGFLRRSERPDATQTEFTIEGLLPGEYLARVNTAVGWVVKSITWKGQDYTDLPFDATATADFSGVEITVTNAAPLLTGTVRDAQGAPATGAVVVFFPVDPGQRRYGFSPARIKSAVAGNTGAYRLTTLPAGSYFVLALPASQGSAWLEPEFLKTAERVATRITVAWSETKTVDLTTAAIR